MDADRYSISQLVGDLKQVRAQFKDEREILSRVRPLACRAALSKETWLEPRVYHADAAQKWLRKTEQRYKWKLRV